MVETAVRMSARQRVVLAALSDERGDYFTYMRVVAEEVEMPPRDVRNAARALARKGYARIEHLFDDMTAMTAGSTYVRTVEGNRALAQMGALDD